MFFKDPETTSIILISGLRRNCYNIIIILLQIFKQHRAYLYKYPEAHLHPQIKTEDHSSQLSIIAECKFHCSLLLKMAKLNAGYPADNQPQNESVFFILTPQFLFQNPFTADDSVKTCYHFSYSTTHTKPSAQAFILQ